MKLLIDADGCPVVEQALNLCAKYKVAALVLCDTAHSMQRLAGREGVRLLTFDKGADSVDFALVNRMDKGDIAVTQDYGLASMCLARGGRVLNQNGLIYDNNNIDALLESRHQNKKLLRAGRHPKGPAKRTAAQDDAFCRALETLLRG